MEIDISAGTPTKEDLKKYLPEFLKEKYPDRSEFDLDESKKIGKEYLLWLIDKLHLISAKTVERHSAAKREHKGKSLVSTENNYTAIDLETTGLDPNFDEIIDIGAIRYRNGNACEKFESLVKPENEIDDFITQLTGITNDMVADAPNIKSILPKFLQFLADDIIVGHNVNFDINFLYDACSNLLNYDFSNNFVDTMRLSRKLFPDLPNHKLSTLIQFFNIQGKNEHRALSDAMCASGCYEYMKKYILDNNIDIQSLHYHKKNLSAMDISTKVTEFDESCPVYGKLFVFTGVLEKMQRKEAMQHVVDLGGQCGDSVTKKTNYLVLGNNDYCSAIKDGKSSKQKKAEKLKLNGGDIEIISENVFYDMTGV